MRSSIARQAVRFTADRCSVAGPSRSSPHRVTRCALSSSSSAKIPAVRAGGSRPQIGSSWSTVPTRTYATYTPPSSESAIPDIPASDTYDIVVIGAANAGLALACALLDKPSIKSTSRILLLDGGSLDRVRNWTGQDVWENRVSSLTAENVDWLRGIGVWQYIAQDRSCPVNEMVVWSNPTPQSTPTLHFPPLGHPMAYMTENTNLQRALLRRIDQVGKGVVEIREGSRVMDMQLGDGNAFVALRIGETQWVKGAVVIGADGPNSPVRKFSQIESYGHAYPTHAVVATMHHDPPNLYPNNTAMQRFLPTGPLAFLPLSPTASTLVWSTRPEHAAAYKRLSAEALTIMVNAGYTIQEAPLAQLNQAVLQADADGKPLSANEITQILANLPHPPNTNNEAQILPPTITSIDPKSIASFPLRLSHADTYLGTRTVLIGDAAHTVHPLAGQGLNMGLADVRVLSDVLEQIRRSGGDYGAKIGLLPYPKERYAQNHLLLSTTDKLHHIFGSRNGAVNWVRGVGLDVINELGPVKKVLMGGAGAKPNSQGLMNEVEGKRGTGWPMMAANGLEGWLGFKNVLGLAMGFAGVGVRNGLRRAADALERR